MGSQLSKKQSNNTTSQSSKKSSKSHKKSHSKSNNGQAGSTDNNLTPTVLGQWTGGQLKTIIEKDLSPGYILISQSVYSKISTSDMFAFCNSVEKLDNPDTLAMILLGRSREWCMTAPLGLIFGDIRDSDQPDTSRYRALNLFIDSDGVPYMVEPATDKPIGLIPSSKIFTVVI